MRDLQAGSGLDDWIYWHIIHTTRNYRQLQCYRYSHTLQFTVAHTMGLSLPWSYPGNGFITDSLKLQITHEAFFSQHIFLSLFRKCQLNSIPLFTSSYPGRLASRKLTQLFSTEIFFITTLHGPRRKHSLSIAGKACLQRCCKATEVSRLLLEYWLPR
jgi:hypothetical protein